MYVGKGDTWFFLLASANLGQLYQSGQIVSFPVEGMERRLDTYFVYADHGTILGYAVLRILADEGEIQRIGVYPHYRRQGIARKLMDAMVTFARARGVRSIALEVRESNLGARNLYDSYGFRQEAVRKGYYHNPAEDAIIMWNRAI